MNIIALLLMQQIIAARYPVEQWNIYGAQASDGDNWDDDSGRCRELLDDELLPGCQYFAYVEIIAEEEARFLKSDGSGTELWLAYRTVAQDWPNFAMKRIARPSDIYPVFHELFARRPAEAD